MTHIINSHYQAITAKYLGPTRHRGARIKASSSGGWVTIDRDYSMNAEDNYSAAVAALIEKLQWGGEWVGVPIDRSGGVYVYVRRH